MATEEPGRNTLGELWAIVGSIPRGRCCAYGTLGKALRNPVSGLLIGRWMAQAPDGVPWWRVVGMQGQLWIDKRGAQFGAEQRTRLEQEGVRFEGDRVDMSLAGWEP